MDLFRGFCFLRTSTCAQNGNAGRGRGEGRGKREKRRMRKEIKWKKRSPGGDAAGEKTEKNREES